MIVRARGMGQDCGTADTALPEQSTTNWPLILGVGLLIMIFIVPNLAGSRR